MTLKFICTKAESVIPTGVIARKKNLTDTSENGIPMQEQSTDLDYTLNTYKCHKGNFKKKY